MTVLFVAAILVTVIALNVRSPEKLQLGQVNARDYSRITRSRAGLGDKSTGLHEIEAPRGGATDSDDDDIVDAEMIDDSEGSAQ